MYSVKCSGCRGEAHGGVGAVGHHLGGQRALAVVQPDQVLHRRGQHQLAAAVDLGGAGQDEVAAALEVVAVGRVLQPGCAAARPQGVVVGVGVGLAQGHVAVGVVVARAQQGGEQVVGEEAAPQPIGLQAVFARGAAGHHRHALDGIVGVELGAPVEGELFARGGAAIGQLQVGVARGLGPGLPVGLPGQGQREQEQGGGEPAVGVRPSSHGEPPSPRRGRTSPPRWVVPAAVAALEGVFTR